MEKLHYFNLEFHVSYRLSHISEPQNYHRIYIATSFGNFQHLIWQTFYLAREYNIEQLYRLVSWSEDKITVLWPVWQSLYFVLFKASVLLCIFINIFLPLLPSFHRRYFRFFTLCFCFLQEFSGNTDYLSVVKRKFVKPLYARYIRIEPTKWSTHGIAMKLELYKCAD